ncbi:MAG: T9SS type A sorting domain-containing protein, partial [Ignavibacteria bacterium]|nr:T9SS type A sorting domain-containing protein [Ignavibacteria bacterium]
IKNDYPEAQIYGVYNWSEDEFAFALDGYYIHTDSTFYYDGVPILIYNHRTKQERMLRIPLDAFEDGINDAFIPIKYIADYEDGKKAIIISFDKFLSMFIIYDPAKDTTVGITDTDAGAIPDLWIRSIYPNPASHKITADIMCFLPDFNDVEIGLYNLMGQKLLDLSNRFEYNDATHTILVDFEVPPELTKGVYYLNIRNSNEIRTKAIVID